MHHMVHAPFLKSLAFRSRRLESKEFSFINSSKEKTMKVVIPQAVVGHIGSWLRERLTVNGKILTAVVGLSGGIDSGLVALICKYHGIPLVCVNMPCHSSAWSMIRAKNLADEYGLKFMIVETTKAADLIRSQVEAGLDIEEDDISRNDLAGLYSTSRSPVLDFVAK